MSDHNDHPSSVTAPGAPHPSGDPDIQPPAQAPADEPDYLPPADEIDITTLSPAAALKLLTATIEALVRRTDLTPPTPPVSNPNTPRIPPASIDKEVEVPSDNEEEKVTRSPGSQLENGDSQPTSGQGSPTSHHHSDIPNSHKTPIGSPETHPSDPHEEDADKPCTNFSVGGGGGADEADSEWDQRARLARRFYSKVAPPIPVAEYLARLHRYCPCSTAVYLAAGLFLLRLAHGAPITTRRTSVASVGEGNGEETEATLPSSDEETTFALPITDKAVHRLSLGALRVTNKALEDFRHPHTRFARVGGVSERELTKLEVNFAFLIEFKLKVSPQELEAVAKAMRGNVKD